MRGTGLAARTVTDAAHKSLGPSQLALPKGQTPELQVQGMGANASVYTYHLFILHLSSTTNSKCRDFKKKHSLNQGTKWLRPFYSGFCRTDIV